MKPLFRQFLDSCLSAENYDFWEATEEYRKLTAVESRREKAREIFYHFIRPGSAEEINIDSEVRKRLIEKIEAAENHKESNEDVFDANLYQNAQR